MNYTISHIYEDYVKTKSDIEKELFVSICSEFNMGIIEYMLEGKPFNMGHNLSSILIVRKDRDPRTPRIDWGESNKYKKELIEKGKELYDHSTGKGEKWHIYYTNEGYLKYHWRKGKTKIKNKSVYRFDATRGLKGNKGKLKTIDELDYYKFQKR